MESTYKYERLNAKHNLMHEEVNHGYQSCIQHVQNVYDLVDIIQRIEPQAGE